MNIVYLHGGPGRNSNAEEQLLKNKISSALNLDQSNIFFWHEPSVNRGYKHSSLSPYEAWFDSAKNSITHKNTILIAHSFAAIAALSLCQELSSSIKKLILIAPAIDIFHVDKMIFSLVANIKNSDFLKNARSDFFNLDAFLQVADYPHLERHYWANKLAMEQYWSINSSSPQWQFDVTSFIGVRQTLNVQLPSNINTPTMAIYGAHDEVVNFHHQNNLIKKIASNYKSVIFANSAHFPSLEESDHFIHTLQNFLYP
ncbi:MAG: hypothetical protein A2504_01420 [Bdellovibrionales bacterium RIFOXYD12_FULL_39_22]|nr:MAG: hypothetical protein A2385_02310 [Bdellovibrionales bacterium RIFOXYB1_FULL_39_21]OFZ42766.1 MAG: hypothetical protein A2485_10495 [Bdellovibrionales bacterium RIFOXYC12_FULL_39_17]OFZ47325.1 MAG: hypothetical protein A2404_15100 [Bdellovibrionales bacterium RIFOXYC1_FULL_39_130]OFZ75491.1 MAG: hypothetical protein A2560_04370 [Bdellovibrionales bacterium RIFOXYD1_FULL_39_84]OFZ93445.1 MAG: hypothetical protein A2504_01420 [Bdellovibrionales bacterium RIFOXYD12_FULL_39_22]HLE12420.1 al